MDKFHALEVFTKVVDSGSFVHAAERLGISPSVASRQVAELESHLQTRLLHRTTRRLSLTESGQAFYERAQQVLADLVEAEQTAAQTGVIPRGTIKLNAALAFGILHLASVLDDYVAKYPEVKIDVTLNDRVVDLVEEGYDLALRIGELHHPNLIARRIGTSRYVVCASPTYLKRHGVPQHPQELEAHNCLVYTYANARREWHFKNTAGTELEVRVSGSLLANNGNLLREAALRGSGVIREPTFLVGEDLHAGRLVALMEDYEGPELPIYLVYASRKHLSAKVRSFVDFLADHFANKPDWGARAAHHPKRPSASG